MRINSIKCTLISGLALCAYGLAYAQTSNSIVTFSVDMSAQVAAGTFTNGVNTVAARGSFNGFGTLNLTNNPNAVGLATNIYGGTTTDTADPNGGVLQYKYWNNSPSDPNGGWESPANEGKNRAINLPSTSGATLVLPTQYFSDAGDPVTNTIHFKVNMAQQINLGNFTVGSSTVYARGSFNNFDTTLPLTNDPSITVTNQYGLVTSNVYVGATDIIASPNASEGFKYYYDPGANWESPSAVNANPDESGNRFFINVAQTLPLVDYSDAPYAPVVSNINFSVDMTVVALTDTNYDSSSVTIWGDFNGWSGGVAMTNDPAASNTNIYTTSSPVSAGVGSTIMYQFRYLQLSTGNTVYDHLNGANGGQGNRSFVVPDVTETNVPPVVFNDAELNDYLLQPTPVFFSVNMSNAVGYGDSHVFDSSLDAVYINGQFANWYTWASGITPEAAPPQYQLFQEGSTLIYTNTIIMASGTAVSFAYKYGIDINSQNQGPADDEAGFGTNHFGVVRSTAFNPYVMPPDKFGNPYAQPFFNVNSPGGGELTIGPVSGGTIPVTWLGRPGAQLQVNSDLTGGSWQSLPETDGTNWTIGYNNPTNGFVSQTNWPATNSKVFFRLIKP